MRHITNIEVPGEQLGAHVPIYLWAPDDSQPEDPLPLLVVNDGPEYAGRSQLLKHVHESYSGGHVPVHRVALVEPVMGKRNEWYTASPHYDRVMASTIIPTLLKAANTTGRVVGMGASLGALSMLSCAERYPGTFGGLFLQSGSFWRAGQEDGNRARCAEYDQVATRVADLHRADKTSQPLHITITCSGAEGNLDCNKYMAETLAGRNHAVAVEWTDGDHSFEKWGEVLHPHLPELLRRCWSEPEQQVA